MKKIYTLLAMLLLLGWQFASAQQTQVADLDGNYVCITQGVPGALTFHVNDNVVELEFCSNVIENVCKTYTEIYPTVTDGQIMARSAEQGNPPVAWPDVRFIVEEIQGRVRINAMYGDGIDYVFERQ